MTDKPAAKMAETIIHPKQDYSELPQKPITLKQGIGGLASQAKANPETVDKTTAASTASKSNKKPSVKRKKPARGQWILRGVSKSAQNAAAKAAQAEGVKVAEWLEQTILRATTSSVESSVTEQHIMQALQDIRIRLERIEYQRHVLSRLWEWLKSRAGW